MTLYLFIICLVAFIILTCCYYATSIQAHIITDKFNADYKILRNEINSSMEMMEHTFTDCVKYNNTTEKDIKKELMQEVLRVVAEAKKHHKNVTRELEELNRSLDI